MEPWILAVLAAIVIGSIYSWLKQDNFSIITSAVCAIVFVIVVVVESSSTIWALDEVAFMPEDLRHPTSYYTILTSMYAHASLGHIVFNVLALIFIGIFLEQSIGTRAFMVIYFVAGLAGTFVFAAVNWSTPYVGAVGASGAISGILGAAARLYPNQRFSLMGLIPMPLWTLTILFVFIQLLIALSSSNISWEAHMGGLAAGLIIAPIIVRTPLHRRVKRMISLSSLRKLATTPELKAILRRIEDEEVPDVKSAWIEHFLSKAKCPHCGSALKVSHEAVMCQKGHLL
jgi:membrane associated rhomboid family serine protease